MKARFALAALIALGMSAPVATSAADKPAAKPAMAAKTAGVKCGSGFIAAGKTCTKDTKPAAAAASAQKSAAAASSAAASAQKSAAAAMMKPAAKPATTKMAAAKPAAKGVKCGNSYIAAGKTCHK